MTIELKEAVKIAKAYIAELYSDEAIADIGLEEVMKDDSGDKWLITIGFVRLGSSDTANKFLTLRNRLYKRVEIDNSPQSSEPGKVLSVQNRITLAV